MQGDDYSDLTYIVGDSYFPPAVHSCTWAQRQTVGWCACMVEVFLYLNSSLPSGLFYQLWVSHLTHRINHTVLLLFYPGLLHSVIGSQWLYPISMLQCLPFYTAYIMTSKQHLSHFKASSEERSFEFWQYQWILFNSIIFFFFFSSFWEGGVAVCVYRSTSCENNNGCISIFDVVVAFFPFLLQKTLFYTCLHSLVLISILGSTNAQKHLAWASNKLNNTLH